MKSVDNELVFGMHGLYSSLGVKIFTSFASVINDPKLIGDVRCIVTIVAPPIFLP